jgi:hypothetical protein
MRMIKILASLFPVVFHMIGERFDSVEARAFILAVALQESGCVARTQRDGGPAKSFWQFEKIGVRGLIANERTRLQLRDATLLLQVEFDLDAIHRAIEFNDLLAMACARLLIAQHPAALPRRADAEGAWQQYLSLWRPGIPRRSTWDAYYEWAWQVIEEMQ